MGRAKAKPKKVPSTDLEGVLGLAAAAPRKRGRPRKIVKEELDQEEEAAEEQEVDEVEPKDDSNNGAESAQDERKLLDLLNKNHDEIGKAVNQQDNKVPKKRGRPPKAQKSSTAAAGLATIDDEQAETITSSLNKKEFQNGIDDSERPAKREGLSRRKSEPRRAAGFAAAR